ncbi:MAG: cupin domain-containing protein [Nanoarchaeota archaeon]|nr:cupin domain-containing protein [Nanoarchaeota archaeon]
MSITKDLIKVRNRGGKVDLGLNGSQIATYSTNGLDLSGRVIDLAKEFCFEGLVGLNDEFFHNFFPQKHLETKSQMKNVAKKLFELDGRTYACLVQYLAPNSSSSEHYHTLDEWIVQLAGKSFIEIRPDNEERRVVEMTPGKILYLAPGTLHIVKTSDEGSLTVPIKETTKKRGDHFYPNTEGETLFDEIRDVMEKAHDTSGIECPDTYLIRDRLRDYYESLSKAEKDIFYIVLMRDDFYNASDNSKKFTAIYLGYLGIKKAGPELTDFLKKQEIKRTALNEALIGALEEFAYKDAYQIIEENWLNVTYGPSLSALASIDYERTIPYIKRLVNNLGEISSRPDKRNITLLSLILSNRIEAKGIDYTLKESKSFLMEGTPSGKDRLYEALEHCWKSNRIFVDELEQYSKDSFMEKVEEIIK